jgi:hypothetical protein
MISLVLLIPAFINVRQITSVPLNPDLSTDQYSDKAFKVSGECIMFIIYELWRLCFAIDGVSPLNTLLFLFFLKKLYCAYYEIKLENNLCFSMFHYIFISL